MSELKDRDVLLEQGVPETVELIAGLLQSFMQTKPGIWQIYNQRRKLPPEAGFYGDVACLGAKPFASNRLAVNDPAQPELLAINTVSVQEVLQVDIFSYDASARLRRFDIPMALNSQAAQSLAEKWAFKIGRVPTNFVDASETEGSSILNRFALTFNVTRAYSRSETAPTFTDFQNPPEKLLVNP